MIKEIIIINSKLYQSKKYTIKFLENGILEYDKHKNYIFINNYIIEGDFDGFEHLLFFDEDYDNCILIRKNDFQIKTIHLNILNDQQNILDINILDNNLLSTKTYYWSNSKNLIKFLDNYEIEVFGIIGKYKFINKYLVKCDFCHKIHLLTFNHDYTDYISIREYDSEIITNNSNIINDKTLNITNFPELIKKYQSKIIKMDVFIKDLLFNYNPLLNKEYKWVNHKIKFISNYQMEAFGSGNYQFINDHLAKCYFGDRIHLITFNHDYTDFISIREDDLEIITNNLNIIENQKSFIIGFPNNQTINITNFPELIKKYQSKMIKMDMFIKDLMFNYNPLLNTVYRWEKSSIMFLKENKMEAFGSGNYQFINNYLVECDFGCRKHLLKFNKEYTKFVSIRKHNFQIVKGHKYIKQNIPKIIMQTSRHKPQDYVINKIKQKCPNWKYIHFNDKNIIKYFHENPISIFHNIVDKFNSLSRGEHKADLFRYYFLYLNGGIFLDSDAIFEENINKIIKEYDSVFVKSFMSNTHLFNGFIATFPRNPIIYDALKHAYEVSNDILITHYHYLCEELWRIYHRRNLINTTIYQENYLGKNLGYSIITDIYDNKIISHHFTTKIIPFD